MAYLHYVLVVVIRLILSDFCRIFKYVFNAGVGVTVFVDVKVLLWL